MDFKIYDLMFETFILCLKFMYSRMNKIKKILIYVFILTKNYIKNF